jgi:anti-sigma factor RsiW
MRDCANADYRDLLPDLVHGRLPADVAREIEGHVAACEACRDELALLRVARGALTAPVAVDVSAIAAAVAAAVRRPEDEGVRSIASARSARVLGPTAFMRRAAVLAVIVLGGLSIPIARQLTPDVAATVAEELSFAGGVDDLADDDLVQLETVIAALESAPAITDVPSVGGPLGGTTTGEFLP